MTAVLTTGREQTPVLEGPGPRLARHPRVVTVAVSWCDMGESLLLAAERGGGSSCSRGPGTCPTPATRSR